MIIAKRLAHTVSLAVLTFIAVVPLGAQERTSDSTLATEAFVKPPPAIAEAVLAPRQENASLGNPSPDGRFLLDGRSAGLPTLALFARPFYRLAGQEIDWQASRSRRLTTRGDVGLVIVDAETGSRTSVQIPAGARMSSPKWSPDGARIGFLVHLDEATHVYVADPTTGRSRQVTRSPVLATLYTSFEWTPDSRSIVTVLVPPRRGAPPAKPPVPTGPQVRRTSPEVNRMRTTPDLLEDPYEKVLLEYYNTGQLAVVDVQSRRTRTVGQPAMIRGVQISPDGGYASVTTMRRPFSYLVGTGQFGSAEEVWSLRDGAVLALLTERPLNEGAARDTTDGDGAQSDKRNVAWRPDGQGLSFLQLEPQAPGDTAQQADTTQTEEAPAAGRGRSRRKDLVMQWLPPFDSTSMTVVYENNARMSGVRYSADAQILFVSEQQGQNATEYAVFLSDPSQRYRIWQGERGRGFGRGGGAAPRILSKTLPNGVNVTQLSADGEHVFLTGVDYADDPMEEGPTSYIDRVTIRTGEKERIYESENDNVWERVVDVLNDDATRLLVSREGPTDVPDSYVRDIPDGSLEQLTQNTDYTPDLTRAQRRRFQVTRVDGFELAVEVTLPEAWQPGEKLPGIIWFYPREYTDQDAYDETLERYNKNRFPAIGTRTMDILTRHGYVVIEPDAPIVGPAGRMNDNYEHDLRNNLAAVIDFLDDEGLIDRHRLAVGGHSYGAFGTVNAMVHTPFFKAGIAGDGNYNRTLTPFSFQSERRSLWEAKDTYFAMSPLFFANNLNGALLMYHGADDQNDGTFPINSWRMFDALEALGKTAALYVYPYEDHGPATEETLLDLWARWTAWLDKYVKNAGQAPEPVAASTGGS